jgi:hypothetical protein
MGAREYDPSLGRWLSADTIVPDPANPQSWNRYSYVLNNPLKYVDPTGMFEEDALIGWFGETLCNYWRDNHDNFWNMLLEADFGDFVFAHFGSYGGQFVEGDSGQPVISDFEGLYSLGRTSPNRWGGAPHDDSRFAYELIKRDRSGNLEVRQFGTTSWEAKEIAGVIMCSYKAYDTGYNAYRLESIENWAGSGWPLPVSLGVKKGLPIFGQWLVQQGLVKVGGQLVAYGSGVGWAMTAYSIARWPFATMAEEKLYESSYIFGTVHRPYESTIDLGMYTEVQYSSGLKISDRFYYSPD